MCGDDEHDEPGVETEGLTAHGSGVSRRGFIGWASAVGAAVWAAPSAAWSRVAAAAPSLTGGKPVMAAMHVHGAWSEREGSWEAYGPICQGVVDVLFMTDHDYRALADKYWTSLNGIPFDPATSGSVRQHAATQNAGSLHLLVESANSSKATTTMSVDLAAQSLLEKLRTSIAGHTLKHTFGSSTLSDGSTYELRITLSKHPAFGGRPAGQYQLWYRFGAGLAAGRHLENGGRYGIVTQPLPATGTTVSLDLIADTAALWPTMMAIDNVLFMMAFVVTSPHSGAVADINVADLQFVRSRNDPASIIADQRSLADAYGARYGITIHPGVEIGRGWKHMNAFTNPQIIPDQALNEPGTIDQFYRQAVANTHALGGLASWNHPFGAQNGPLVSGSQEIAKRRSTFKTLQTTDMYGCDILEVGYGIRGRVDTSTHADLWDTFSRRARFLTANGVSDDHRARDWRTINNGFSTGIWSASNAHADLMSAMLSGRAFTSHSGRWTGAQLDMVVDDSVLMGKVSVSSVSSRSLAIFAASMPAGSVMEIVQGPVDYTGNDPGTVIIDSIPASSFGAAGTVSRTINTSSSTFVRTQVRTSAGEIVGVGNPIWLLRSAPPGGIPNARMP